MASPLIVEFKPEHLAKIKPPALTPEQARVLSASGMDGESYTAIVGVEILGCAGFVDKTDGVVSVWAVLSPSLACRHAFFLHRTVKRGIEARALLSTTRQFEATVLKGFDAAEKWLHVLGFKCIEEMPNRAGTNETYLRFIR